MEISATAGNLIKLRKQLSIIKKVDEILKMKRDDISKRISLLLEKLHERGKFDEEIIKIYQIAKKCYSNISFEKTELNSRKVGNLEIELKIEKLATMKLPKIFLKKLPEKIFLPSYNLSLLQEKILEILPKLIEVAEIENRIEILTKELEALNKKVNIIEKILIPSFENSIKYIENSLFEEEIEEFSKLKYII